MVCGIQTLAHRSSFHGWLQIFYYLLVRSQGNNNHLLSGNPYRVHNHWGSHEVVAPGHKETSLTSEQALFGIKNIIQCGVIVRLSLPSRLSPGGLPSNSPPAPPTNSLVKLSPSYTGFLRDQFTHLDGSQNLCLASNHFPC